MINRCCWESEASADSCGAKANTGPEDDGRSGVQPAGSRVGDQHSISD